VGERLEQTPRADHIRTAPDLHRSPDLAVGEENVGDRDQQDDEEEHALPDHDQERQDVIGPEFGHGRIPYSAAVMAVRPCASAEHSAITEEQRAMALVK